MFFSFLTVGLEYDVRGTSPLWWECMAFVERRPSSANLGGAYDVRGTSPPKFVRVRRFWFDSGFLATSGHELTQNRARTEANTSVQGNLEVMGGGAFLTRSPRLGRHYNTRAGSAQTPRQSKARGVTSHY